MSAVDRTAFSVCRVLGPLLDEFLKSAKGLPFQKASAERKAKISGCKRRLRQDRNDERNDKANVLRILRNAFALNVNISIKAALPAVFRDIKIISRTS